MDIYKIILIILIALLVTLIYISLSIITANKTRNTGLSFFQLFLISFFLTPLAGAALLFTSKEKFNHCEYHYSCSRCGFHFTEKQDNCPQCKTDGYTQTLVKMKKISLA